MAKRKVKKVKKRGPYKKRVSTTARAVRKEATMAKVQVQVTGGSIVSKEASTVGDIKKIMGAEKYTATVNGEPVGDDHELSDYEFVALAPSVKGAKALTRKYIPKLAVGL